MSTYTGISRKKLKKEFSPGKYKLEFVEIWIIFSNLFAKATNLTSCNKEEYKYRHPYYEFSKYDEVMMVYNFENHSSLSFDISVIEAPHMILKKEKSNDVDLPNKILLTKESTPISLYQISIPKKLNCCDPYLFDAKSYSKTSPIIEDGTDPK